MPRAPLTPPPVCEQLPRAGSLDTLARSVLQSRGKLGSASTGAAMGPPPTSLLVTGPIVQRPRTPALQAGNGDSNSPGATIIWWAHGSAGERLLHTQEVGGSNPPAPTTDNTAIRVPLTRANSSAEERLPYKQEVTGSSPVSPTGAGAGATRGAVVQRLAHRPVKPEVAGSNPVGSATIWHLAGLAQVVERGTENPGVPSSTLGPGTNSPLAP